VLTQGNVGTAFRHRAQYLWVLALLAPAGAHWILTRWRGRATSASGL
jgi:hypothetical protein